MATPHFYPHVINVERFLALVNSTAEELISHVKEPSVNICLGAEVLYCDRLESMEGLEQLCIRGTRVLLLELPMEDTWSDELFYSVKTLAKKYTVVLAHIDRYIRRHKSDIEELLDLGAYAQINAYAFASMGTRHKLASFLEGDRVVALGSDLHGADTKSYEKFILAKKRLGDIHDQIMERTAALLSNAEYLNK
ncbi:MAG: hypothetical protein IJY47_02030 [Clostridia bacterium]|nr:hypothetical protein [Clostridia bacterium]